MEKILAAITLSKVLSVCLFLVSIWLITIIIKKEKHNFVRGILFFIFLLAALFFVNESDNKQLTLISLRDQFFPVKALELDYSTSIQGSGLNQETIYSFNEPRPIIQLSLDNQGEYFHITNPESVNRILKQLGLPLVDSGVPEFASLTGSFYHRGQYRWENYPRGVLTLSRTRCKNKETLRFYNCVVRISISTGH